MKALEVRANSHQNWDSGNDNVETNLPNLLVIGAQKSATTWLARVLDSSPAIYFPPGEQQFFNRNLLQLPGYKRFYNNAHHFQIRGDKTPDYLHMATWRIEYARSILPKETKILAILRRPDERMWSHARMEVSGFNARALDQSSIPALERHVLSWRNRQRTKYAAHLRRWQRVFGAERVRVIFYDEIVEDSRQVIVQLLQWLNVHDATVSEIPTRVWESPSLNMPTPIRSYLQDITKTESQHLENIGLEVPLAWQQQASSFTSNRLLLRRLQMLVPNCMAFAYDWIRDLLPYSLASKFTKMYTNRMSGIIHS